MSYEVRYLSYNKTNKMGSIKVLVYRMSGYMYINTIVMTSTCVHNL